MDESGRMGRPTGRRRSHRRSQRPGARRVPPRMAACPPRPTDPAAETSRESAPSRELSGLPLDRRSHGAVDDVSDGSARPPPPAPRARNRSGDLSSRGPGRAISNVISLTATIRNEAEQPGHARSAHTQCRSRPGRGSPVARIGPPSSIPDRHGPPLSRHPARTSLPCPADPRQSARFSRGVTARTLYGGSGARVPHRRPPNFRTNASGDEFRPGVTVGTAAITLKPVRPAVSTTT